MKSPFYRIFVGHYDKPADSKSVVAKLREQGLTPSIFKVDDGYSILITATLNKEKAEMILVNLIKKGFDAFISEPDE